MKLFNKKYYMDGKPKEEDVPGELPALGEIGEGSSTSNAIPDELPNLDAPAPQAKPQKEQASQAAEQKAPEIEEEAALPDLPESLPSLAKPAALKQSVSSAGNSSVQTPIASQKAPVKNTSVSFENLDKDFPSFFSSAGSLSSAGVNGNLLSAMKKYWDKNRILEVPHKSDIVNETEIAIQAEVDKLKELEKAWLSKMKDFNILKQNIAYLEAEISTHSDELAALLSAGKSQKHAKQKPKKNLFEKSKVRKYSKKR